MTGRASTGVDWKALDGVIFDVDGTLFDHLALRRPMAVRLATEVMRLRMPPRDLVALQRYRKTRDRLAMTGAEDIGRLQFEAVARDLGRSSGEIEAIATRWMCEEPLPLVSRFAFPGTGAVIDALRAQGLRVGVFSDYPTDGKLHALGLTVELACDAGQPEIGRLKPDPKGFLHVASRLGVAPARCLVIGDRDDRDGEAARRGGFPWLCKAPDGSAPRVGVFVRYGDLLAEIESRRRPA